MDDYVARKGFVLVVMIMMFVPKRQAVSGKIGRENGADVPPTPRGVPAAISARYMANDHIKLRRSMETPLQKSHTRKSPGRPWLGCFRCRERSSNLPARADARRRGAASPQCKGPKPPACDSVGHLAYVYV